MPVMFVGVIRYSIGQYQYLSYRHVLLIMHLSKLVLTSPPSQANMPRGMLGVFSVFDATHVYMKNGVPFTFQCAGTLMVRADSTLHVILEANVLRTVGLEVLFNGTQVSQCLLNFTRLC